MTKFSAEDHWKALILHGLNQATYKIALGQTLLNFCRDGYSTVAWDTLSKEYLDIYIQRLSSENSMPQQANPARRTVMERIVNKQRLGKLSLQQAAEEVGSTAFEDVIPRFHNLARHKSFQGMFYEFEMGKEILLTDELHAVAEASRPVLELELGARWSLLEGAFEINHNHYGLANDIRETYLTRGYERKTLTGNIPFLQAYQGNVCFYCGEFILQDVEVDHVLPRQVVQHDEIWNLVLGHGLCNGDKSDKVVGEHFIIKLIARNENIIGSNHPWRNKIIQELGSTPPKRRGTLRSHYHNVRKVLGPYYWGGSPSYDPRSDPFYRRLITKLNER